MTNYEKIKAMSVEEMAATFGRKSLCDYIIEHDFVFCITRCRARKECTGCAESWLLQEADE